MLTNLRDPSVTETRTFRVAFASKDPTHAVDQFYKYVGEELPKEGDIIEVRALVDEHLERTGSPVARRVLDNWDELLPKFIKIFPTDYKRVLAERAEAERAASESRAEVEIDG